MLINMDSCTHAGTDLCWVLQRSFRLATTAANNWNSFDSSGTIRTKLELGMSVGSALGQGPVTTTTVASTRRILLIYTSNL